MQIKKEAMSAEDVQIEFDSDARYKQILQVSLGIENILEILDTLYFDGKIEPLEPSTRVEDGVKCKFRVRPEPFGKASRLDLSISPCSRCHLMNELWKFLFDIHLFTSILILSYLLVVLWAQHERLLGRK